MDKSIEKLIRVFEKEQMKMRQFFKKYESININERLKDEKKIKEINEYINMMNKTNGIRDRILKDIKKKEPLEYLISSSMLDLIISDNSFTYQEKINSLLYFLKRNYETLQSVEKTQKYIIVPDLYNSDLDEVLTDELKDKICDYSFFNNFLNTKPADLSEEMQKIQKDIIMDEKLLCIVNVKEALDSYRAFFNLIDNEQNEKINGSLLDNLLMSVTINDKDNDLFYYLRNYVCQTINKNYVHPNKAVNEFLKYIRSEEALNDIMSFIKSRTPLLNSKKSPLPSSLMQEFSRISGVLNALMTSQICISGVYDSIMLFQMCIDDLERFLVLPVSKLEEEKISITKYSKLNFFLDRSPLNKQVKFDVIIYIIEKQVEALKLQNTTGNGNYHLYDFGNNFIFDSVPKKYEQDFIRSGRIIDLLYDEEFIPLDEKEELILKEFRDYDARYDIYGQIKQTVTALNNINEHYINKGRLTNKDIEIVISSFKSLGFTENIIQLIQSILNRELSYSVEDYQQINKPTIPAPYVKNKPEPKDITPQKTSFTEAEWKGLKKTLKGLYNPHTGEFIRELSYEETLQVASIMLDLDYNLDEVKSLLRRAMNLYDFESIENIEEYTKLKDKILFYYGEEYINELDAYLQEYLSSSLEEAEFWQESLMQELSKISFPSSYAYELELAKSKTILYCKRKKR